MPVRYNHFGEISAKAAARARALIVATARNVEGAAKANAPVLTGNLRNSIETMPGEDLSARVNVGAYYGIYVEYGTSRMGAEPFLTPAVDAARAPFLLGVAAILRGDDA